MLHMIYTISFIIICFLLAIFFIVRAYYERLIKKTLYLYIDVFIRHMHDEKFYQGQSIMHLKDIYDRYCKFYQSKDKWYISDNAQYLLITVGNEIKCVNCFCDLMKEYLSAGHYFTFPEFQQTRRFFRTEELNKIINDEFLYIVNRYEPGSFRTKDEYTAQLDRDLNEMKNRHNKAFVLKELEENRTFFDTVMKYPLDGQQRESIVKLEYNTLVVSSAGSGKTSTTIGKIKYLVERKGIRPRKLLALTYAKKAAEELSDRLGYKDKGMVCHTFHGLAYDIIRKTEGTKPDICPTGAILQSFCHQTAVNPSFKEAVNTYLTRWASLTQYSHKYVSAKDYYRDRALYGIQAPFLDIDGRIIFTRSEEEKKICTFLSMNGVPFRYEHPFPYSTGDSKYRQYIPDFTIYIKRDGKWYFLILEHFGIDQYGNVPKWFGEYKAGGWQHANQKYNDGIRWKREITTRYNIPLIETTSSMFHDGTIFSYLTEKLQEYGVCLQPLTEEEKFERLVRRNKRTEDSLVRLVGTFITLMKAGNRTFEDILKTIRGNKNISASFVNRSVFMIERIFRPVYEDYCRYLNDYKKMDYTDLILRATSLCETGKYVPDYDYILVDEFQDISVDRFRLLQALRKNDYSTKLYAVGDDWQSIFRFSGSDLSLFSEFDRFFGFSEKCRIETTYRFGNPLIDISSGFILTNDFQLPKQVRPKDHQRKTDVRMHSYDENNQWEVLKGILQRIPDEESIMLVGRYNSDSDFIPYSMMEDLGRDSRTVSIRWKDKSIPYYTIHSAKGLEADHVILVNCSQEGNGFPSTVSDDPILGFVLSKAEDYPFAEERRLFYVAMTRSRKTAHIMYKDTCPSPFVTELNKGKNDGKTLKCPVCQVGQLRITKEGENSRSCWRLYHCSNNTAGCNYSWFVDFHNENEIRQRFEVECGYSDKKE